MDLFVLDKLIVLTIINLTWDKIFIYLVGVMFGVYAWIGIHHKKKVVSK